MAEEISKRDQMSGKATDTALEAAKPAYPTGTAQKPTAYNATQPSGDPWGADWHNGSMAYHTERSKADPQATPHNPGDPANVGSMGATRNNVNTGKVAPHQPGQPNQVNPQTYKDHPDSYKRQSNAKELA